MNVVKCWVPADVNAIVMAAGTGKIRIEVKEWSHTPRNYRLNQNEKKLPKK